LYDLGKKTDSDYATDVFPSKIKNPKIRMKKSKINFLTSRWSKHYSRGLTKACVACTRGRARGRASPLSLEVRTLRGKGGAFL
jgi:hypothetical protein